MVKKPKFLSVREFELINVFFFIANCNPLSRDGE